MSQYSVPTVLIVGEEGAPVILNESDFDAEKHKLYVPAGDLTEEPAVKKRRKAD